MNGKFSPSNISTTGPGTGDVIAPVSSTTNQLAKFSDGTGKNIADSSLNDNGSLVKTKADVNLSVGGAAVGTGGKQVVVMKVGTAPSTVVVGSVECFAVNSGDGTATLGLMLEQAVEAIGTFTPSHKIKINLNGQDYWLQLDLV